MRQRVVLLFFLGSIPVTAWAQVGEQLQSPAEPPALTIYNGNFAVVRETIPLDLQAGINHVTFPVAAAHIEPDSVALRDPAGRRNLQILEQNYRNDPIAEDFLLFLNEGKTLDFQIGRWMDKDGQEHQRTVSGKVIRSGYQNQGRPIVEVNGQLQFNLPGPPVFPSLGYNTILKPALDWVLETDHAGRSMAELSYVTKEMSWHADYNVVAPEKGDTVDLVGWITIVNKSGKEFESARIKLIAGDVNKITPAASGSFGTPVGVGTAVGAVGVNGVNEKVFDEYHLYTLERSTTLHDRETKQVEFVAASGIKSQTSYVYNGVAEDVRYAPYYGYEAIRNNASYGTRSSAKVWVMQEFKNSKANHLGMPLPKGRLRFYRQNDDGQMELTGENTIDHTPSDETLRVYTGNAFDIVGERRQTDYNIDAGRKVIDESIEITLRNHKKEAVEVRVKEPLYRGSNWKITKKTNEYQKLDPQTVEFVIRVPANGEEVIAYTAHYSW